MTDYQQIADEFRSALLSASSETTPHLRQKTEDYTSACVEINQRLAECDGLLQRGLRSEALQLCDRDPNLLDIVALMDIPEQTQWHQILQTYGVVIPPLLKVDVGAELNDAYAAEQLVEPLLARHRLLALARSPLPLRIEVLRQLAESDPTNPVWNEDRGEFETERLKKIVQEATQAEGRGDVDTLVQLHEEILNTAWREMPAESVVRHVEKARLNIELKAIRGELQEVVNGLETAASEGDVATARILRDQYFELAPGSKLSAESQVIQRAGRILAWLNNIDEEEARRERLDKLVNALRRALNTGARTDYLEHLFNNFASARLKVPADLLQNYTNEMAKRKQAQTRLAVIGYGIGVGFLVLLLGMMGWVIMR